MKKVFILVGLFILVLVVGGWGYAKPVLAKAPNFTWRYQTFQVPTSCANYAFCEKWCELVTKRSGGRITIRHYDTGAIVAPRELADALSKGLVEAGNSSGAHWKGRMPEGDIEYGLAWSGMDMLQWYDMYYKYKDGLFSKIMQECYHEQGVHEIAATPCGDYGLMTKFPIRKMEDLKGKKIRIYGTDITAFFREQGAAPVTFPAAEMYMALQRGTIDGTAQTIFKLKTSRLAEVVDYVTLPCIQTVVSINMIANLDAWNQLPKDLQKLLEDTGRELAINSYVPEEARITKEALKWATDEHKVEIITLSEDEQARWAKAIRPLWKLKATTPRSKQILGLIREYRKEKGIR